MVGSAVWRALESKGYTNLIGKTSKELDLTEQQAVLYFYNQEQPEVVIDAAAKVGGILANNDFPYQFLMENMQIQNNLIDGAHNAGIEKFIFLGSSCIYPKFAKHPLKEVLSIDPSYFRPTEVDLLIGDPTKAKEKLRWVPEHDLASLVKDMMQSDVKLMQKEQYLKAGGYNTNNKE